MTNICVKNEKPSIDIENIWNGALFDRKTTAADFSRIIKSISQPFVLSINAQYGTGKSFFLERWAKELEKEEEKVVFFNAWNCDFVQKPLLPFLYEFLEQLKGQAVVEYTFEQDVENSGSVIIEAVKEATRSTFDIDRFLEATKNLCSGDSFRIRGNALEEYQELQSVITNFKDNLSRLIEEKMGDKNIYVFIDELERCRPTFAVELLEAIKHLFDIKGLVFILGIDREQLRHTISTIYGQGMDGEGYLRRFIDLELYLPEPKIDEYTKVLSERFCIAESASIRQNNVLCGEDYFTWFFNIFAEAYGVTLRETEQIYTQFAVLAKIMQSDKALVTPLLAFMLVLKAKDEEYYLKLGKEIKSYKGVDDYLNDRVISKIGEFTPSNKQVWSVLEQILLTCFMSYDEIVNKVNEHTNLLMNNPSDPKVNQLKQFYDCIRARYMEIHRATGVVGLQLFDYIRNKIVYNDL